jgi:hypothetical protein
MSEESKVMEFLSENASAVFALVGAIGGAGLTFLSGWLLRKREYDLRLWESLMERPIQAHERLLELASEMRVTVSLEEFDAKGELRRAPEILVSRETFEAWFERVGRAGLQRSVWLIPLAKREANFLQDYLASLHANLRQVPDGSFLAVGAILREDFIHLSDKLERAAYTFFERDLHRLKLADLKEWHKYRKEETLERLKKTALVARWSEITNLIPGDGSS